MSFSPGQQKHYRPLIEAAWLAHAKAENLDPKSAQGRRSWYESQLLACVGVTSTIPLDKGRDFAVAIAHFEHLADAGTYWQERAETDDARRILYSAFGHKGPYLLDGHVVDAAYLSGIAQQTLRLPTPPALRTLKKPLLTAITRHLAIHVRRVKNRA